MERQAPIVLGPRWRVVFELYFGDEALPQTEIAALCGVSQSAISKRIKKIRAIFKAAGLELPTPGRGLELVRPRTLSGFWLARTREYVDRLD